jgi:hypothetical protein
MLACRMRLLIRWYTDRYHVRKTSALLVLMRTRYQMQGVERGSESDVRRRCSDGLRKERGRGKWRGTRTYLGALWMLGGDEGRLTHSKGPARQGQSI